MNKKYRKAVILHLADYKVRALGIEANGTWWGNCKEYGHILPEELSDLNIIDKGYHPRIADMIKKKSRHLGFHHLNSSQALTANLFGPFIKERKIDQLKNLFGLELINGVGLFEHIHDRVEGTNFDFAVTGLQTNLFVEVKYTEDRFGSAKRDQHHIEKYKKIYQGRLKKIVDISADEFFRDYQLWRNICYSDLGLVAFVIPKFRKDLVKKVEAAKERIHNPEKVRIVWIDDICRQGELQSSSVMKAHYVEFRRKYLEITNA